QYRHTWIGYASPIILNALLISAYLHLIFQVPYWLAAVGIALSEAVSVLAIGIPLLRLLKTRGHRWL
ncbi:MAG: QueT transporter family protein, partial [Firmicutes bacterium]|nr:QueT transporter family protein [Bacillota bacterium]